TAQLPTSEPTIPMTTIPPTAAPTATAIASDAVDLDAKIGQMLMLGFRGMQLAQDNPIYADLQTRNLGSVVLFQYDAQLQSFDRNILSPAQVKALNQALQAAAATPLFISTDQEGGIINRLTPKDGFPATNSEQYYGTLNQPEVTRAAAAA